MKVIDLTPSTSILSVSLLHAESDGDISVNNKKQYRNVDSRFGNTTYNRLELDHEGGTVPLDARSEIYRLPAGSEVEVEVDVSGTSGVGTVPSDSTSTAECMRWSVASSVMCVLHAVNKKDGSTVSSDSQLMKALDFIIKSQIRSPSSTGETTVDAADSEVNTDVRGRVRVMLGRGSVGAAWWDTMR